MMRISVDDKVYVSKYDKIGRIATLLDGIAIVEFQNGERAKVKPDEMEPAKDTTSIQESDFDRAALEVLEEFRSVYEGEYMDDIVMDICDTLKSKLFKEG